MRGLFYRYLVLTLLIVLLNPLSGRSIKKILTPDFISFHTGGNLGYGSGYFGYSFGKRDRFDLEFGLGYTPKRVSGKSISQFNIRNRFNLRTVKNSLILLRPYLGLNIMLNTKEDSNIWFKLPSKYPSRYYLPTAIHGVLAVGTKFKIRSRSYLLKSLTFKLEVSSLDAAIRAHFVSRGDLPFSEVWSGSFGVDIAI